MQKEKIDQFLAVNNGRFLVELLGDIREKLAGLDESQASTLMATSFKNPTTTLILSILLGTIGVDRFYLGQVGLGIVKIITCGGVYIWWIIDMCQAFKNTRKYNYNKLMNEF